MSKLALGTVQFGCQYGINSAGRPDNNMVRQILEEACNHGIKILDTSAAYGNSEEVLGSTGIADRFKIVSKYPKCEKTVKETLDVSLKNLGCNRLYGYLLHHFSVYTENKAIWNDFIQLKKEGLVEKIGFSLYEPSELDIILADNIPFDIIQIPYNVFDRQFEPYFQRLKEKGVEIHVRSTFLQGLFFMDRESLPEKLLPLKYSLLELDRHAGNYGISVGDLALNYNIHNKYIDGVLIGVDNKEQLLKNIESVSDTAFDINIKIDNQELLKPVNWN